MFCVAAIHGVDAVIGAEGEIGRDRSCARRINRCRAQHRVAVVESDCTVGTGPGPLSSTAATRITCGLAPVVMPLVSTVVVGMVFTVSLVAVDTLAESLVSPDTAR